MDCELGFKEQWAYTILAGLLFLLLSSTFFYGFLNYIMTSIRFPATMTDKGPTIFGLLLTTIIFILLYKYIVF